MYNDYFFRFIVNVIKSKIKKYPVGTIKTNQLYKLLFWLIANPGNISKANNGNAIDIAVPLPTTISSATGDSKSWSTPLSRAKPVEAVPVNIPNSPKK